MSTALTDDLRTRIIKAHDANLDESGNCELTMTDLARRFGVSQGAVTKILVAAGRHVQVARARRTGAAA